VFYEKDERLQDERQKTLLRCKVAFIHLISFLSWFLCQKHTPKTGFVVVFLRRIIIHRYMYLTPSESLDDGNKRLLSNFFCLGVFCLNYTNSELTQHHISTGPGLNCFPLRSMVGKKYFKSTVIYVPFISPKIGRFILLCL